MRMNSIRKKKFTVGGIAKQKYNCKNYLKLQKKIVLKRVETKSDKAKLNDNEIEIKI